MNNIYFFVEKYAENAIADTDASPSSPTAAVTGKRKAPELQSLIQSKKQKVTVPVPKDKKKSEARSIVRRVEKEV